MLTKKQMNKKGRCFVSKKIGKSLLTLLIVIGIAGLLTVGYFHYTSLDDVFSEYKIKPSHLLSDAVVWVDAQELIIIPTDADVLLNNDDNSIAIGSLNEGDIVQKISVSTNGWSKIVYNEQEAYMKSAALVINAQDLYKESNDHLYVLPESINVLSVNKSSPRTETLTIQTEVDRVAVGDNGMSKILYNNTEYYIPSEYLSIERPVIWTDVESENIRYVSPLDGVSVMNGWKEDSTVLSDLNWFESVQVVSNGDNGWSKIVYGDNLEGYIQSDTVVEDIFPIVYEDDTCKITIYKEWYKKAWCYAAHLEFTDYARLSTDCANGKYGSGNETTPHAAKRLNALFAVNGCYSAPYLGYTVIRGGKICNGWGRALNIPGVYSANTGLFSCAWCEGGGASGIAGYNVTKLVESGKVTDSFCFGPPSLVNGYLKGSNGGARAQRTMMGTNGQPGDIWLVVSDGRYNDGESAGLTFYEGAKYLQEKGCMFGIHLDGGGSSTMYFNGLVLNAVRGNERAVVDFVYFK